MQVFLKNNTPDADEIDRCPFHLIECAIAADVNYTLGDEEGKITTCVYLYFKST